MTFHVFFFMQMFFLFFIRFICMQINASFIHFQNIYFYTTNFTMFFESIFMFFLMTKQVKNSVKFQCLIQGTDREVS